MAFKLRDLVARLRITVDKKTAADAEKEVSGGFDRMAGMAKKVGAAIASAFVVDRIIQVGRALVRTAAEAEIPWNRLGNSLDNVGVKLGDVERRVKTAARAMADTSTVGDEQFAETLDRLVALSGDFEGSLKNVQLVADVAAKFFKGELAPAADLVGRAMGGNVRMLKQLGINTKDANEGLRILAERSEGAANNELNTLHGRTKQLAEEWDNLREAVGGALTKLLAFVGGAPDAEIGMNRWRLFIKGLADGIERIGQTTEQMREVARADELRPGRGNDIAVLPTLVIDAEDAKAAARAEQDAAEKRRRARDEEIDALAKLLELGQLKNKDAIRALQLQRELTLELARTTTAAGRADLLQKLETIRGAAGRADPLAAAKAMRPGVVGSNRAGITGMPRDVSAINKTPEERIEEANAALELMQETLREVMDIGLGAAHGITGAFQDGFAILIEEMGDLKDAATTLAKGITAAFIGGVAEWANRKVMENVAAAIEAGAYALGFVATGNFASTGAAWASAAKHTAAALAWAAVAGGARAGAAAMSGGGGNRGAGGAGAATQTPFDTARNGPTTIIYVDGFNPKNPVHVRTLGQGVKALGETDSSIEVRPRAAG